LRALILAGGFGTRLRPLTYTRPKHLLPIVNRPHLEHVFDLLLEHGVSDVVLLTSYLAKAFDDVMERARGRGLSVATTYEKEPLGTAGAIKYAQDFVGDSTFLVFNGDILSDMDLSALVDFHRQRAAKATIALQPVEDPSIYGVVPTDEEGRVEGFVEKPPPGEAPTKLINAGVYVFEPDVLSRVPAGEVWSAERQLFPDLVADGGLYARHEPGYWMDIGTPEKYLRANIDALKGEFRAADLDRRPGDLVVADEADVGTHATVELCCVGAGARIADDCEVTRSVLLPGAVIEAGAVVRESILGERARVGPGVVLDSETLGDDEHRP
jgi:mannose-1-phosphate guanylyltransferase